MSDSASQTRPGPARRWLRRVLVMAATAVSLGILLLGALRLYCNDARLARMLERTLSERLHTEVHLGTLQLSLWNGVEIANLRVGPPPHFAHDVLRVERFAVHWQLSSLLRGAVVLPEVAMTGVRASFEENAHGRNVDALMAALQGPSRPTAPAAAPGSARQGASLASLQLPLEVRVERLALELRTLTVNRPHQRGELTQIWLQGHFSGHGTALQTSLWLGLGEPDPGTGTSALHLETDAPQHRVDVTQRLSVRLESSGFGDLRMALDWQADAHGAIGEQVLSPMHLNAKLRTDVSVLNETVHLTTCELAFGSPAAPAAQVQLEAAANHLLGTPQVALEKLQGVFYLDALQPYLAPFVPGTHLRGTVRLRLLPLQGSVAALQGWQGLSSTTEIDTEELGYRAGTLEALGVNSHTSVRTEAGGVQVHTEASLRRAAAGDNVAQDVRLQLDAETPLAPWLGGAAAGEVPVNLAMHVDRGGGPAFAARGVDIKAQVWAPVTLLRQASGGSPLRVQVQGNVAQAAAGPHSLQKLVYSLAAEAWDLSGKRADARFNMQLGQVAVRVAQDTITIPHAGLHFDVQRRHDSYTLRELRATAASDWQLTLQGAVDDATSPAPTFHGLRAEIAPLSLDKAIATVPVGLRPAGQVAGTFAATAELDGTVPYAELLAHGQPPRLPHPDDPAWNRAVQDTVIWLQQGVDRLEHGLPFHLDTYITLQGVNYANGPTEVAGLQLTQDFALRPHGPVYRLQVDIPNLAGTAPMQGVHMDMEASLQGGALRLRNDTRIERLQAQGQPNPVQDMHLVADLDYAWGGDLRLQELSVTAANSKFTLSLEGLLAQPIHMMVSRAWSQAGMPGIEARLAWKLGVHVPDLERLRQAEMVFGGALDMGGEVHLNDGDMTLTGEVRMDHINVEQGTTIVEQMSGVLPFNMHLLFGQRPDSTIVVRNLGIGGGVLSLVTAEEDIRNRPARPVYYDRLRPYRPGTGITAVRLQSGPYELLDFALEGRLIDGMLLADWIAMNILGGDVVGNLALQLGRDNTVRGDLTFQVSNMDASYFPALKLKPGPESELSADLRMSAMFGAQGRDLTMNMNVTKIGDKALDRFLQLLDPAGQDAKLQSTRKNLQYVRIQELAMWIRYENLNMDLVYDPILAIPFTRLGYRPIEREMLRRYAVGESLDVYLQPYVNKFMAPALGWTHGHD